MTDLVAKLESVLFVGEDRLGAGTLVATDSWVQLTTPDAKTLYRNCVLRSVLEADELEARIDETIAHYRDLGVPFRWFVTPSTRPCDTAQVLLRKGFEPFETLHAMTADPADFPPHKPGDVTVERVGEDGIDTWVDCLGRGWDMPAAGRERFREELRVVLARPAPKSAYFLARFRGAPAGAGSVTLRDGFGHFNGSAVDPEFRRRGVYRALVLERMRFLRDRGETLASNHCVSTTSAPICARLGFRRICDFEIYAWKENE